MMLEVAGSEVETLSMDHSSMDHHGSWDTINTF
jgi:hypothetical protein